jgi:hypothetical protein
MNGSNLFCAIRGPVMLITIGALFALDHNGFVSFGRTWPLLIIVFGVLKLLERVVVGTVPPQSYPPPPSYSGTTPGGAPGGGV